ncbi:MAG: hypothetical protein KKC79_10095 [Gammaproteobacteria bacterium]|nr:hypothetical protein [Gammaproteobacteria bacterium]MBU1440966.1 hypothetical protein [Gammaproteobacteria bacterium]MBU2287723.1 hypothetical protein [Gammaproteobacteria bacterium]MBU2408984.1 hypothetical protein [Gammaproteobacteria bacterium]
MKPEEESPGEPAFISAISKAPPSFGACHLREAFEVPNCAYLNFVSSTNFFMTGFIIVADDGRDLFPPSAVTSASATLIKLSTSTIVPSLESLSVLFFLFSRLIDLISKESETSGACLL